MPNHQIADRQAAVGRGHAADRDRGDRRVVALVGAFDDGVVVVSAHQHLEIAGRHTDRHRDPQVHRIAVAGAQRIAAEHRLHPGVTGANAGVGRQPDTVGPGIDVGARHAVVAHDEVQIEAAVVAGHR